MELNCNDELSFLERRREIFYTYLNYGRYSIQFQGMVNKYELLTETLMGSCKKYLEKHATIKEIKQYYIMKQKDAEIWEEQKDPKIKKKYEYAFNACINNCFDINKLVIAARSIYVTAETLKNYAKQYLMIYAGEEETKKYEDAYKKYQDMLYEEKIKESHLRTKDAKSNLLLQILSGIKNKEESNKFLLGMRIDNTTYLIKRVDDFIRIRKDHLSKEEKKTLEIKLRDSLEEYGEYLKLRNQTIKDTTNQEKQSLNEEEERKLLKQAQILISTLIKSNFLTKEQFCKESNIELVYLEECISLVKKYDNDLFAKYSSRIESLRNQRFAVIVSKIEDLILKIKTGIIEDGIKIRDYDLLDYYLNNKDSLDELKEKCSKLHYVEDLRILINFISINKNTRPLNISQTLKDKNILLQNGVQRTILEEEKKLVISYLERNYIPILDKTYSIALRRYLDGKLVEREYDQNLENQCKTIN